MLVLAREAEQSINVYDDKDNLLLRLKVLDFRNQKGPSGRNIKSVRIGISDADGLTIWRDEIDPNQGETK